MYFYVFKEDTRITGFLQSEMTVNLPHAVPVSMEEYKHLGGVISYVSETKSPVENRLEQLEGAIDILTGGKDDELDRVVDSGT